MILVIDTSTEWIGLGLHTQGQIIAELVWKSYNHHSVELVPAINRMFKQTNTQLSQLKGLGIALGPGSFTSLRIGMAVIKGLALALKLPVVGIPSLDILASGQPFVEMPILALLHVGRGRFASMRYHWKDNGWKSVEPLSVSDVKELAQTIISPICICGEMDPEEKRILSRKWKTVKVATAANCLRRPAVFAELVAERLEKGDVADINALSPIYVQTLSNVPDL